MHGSRWRELETEPAWSREGKWDDPPGNHGNKGLQPYRQNTRPRQFPTLQSMVMMFGRSPVL